MDAKRIDELRRKVDERRPMTLVVDAADIADLLAEAEANAGLLNLTEQAQARAAELAREVERRDELLAAADTSELAKDRDAWMRIAGEHEERADRAETALATERSAHADTMARSAAMAGEGAVRLTPETAHAIDLGLHHTGKCADEYPKAGVCQCGCSTAKALLREATLDRVGGDRDRARGAAKVEQVSGNSGGLDADYWVRVAKAAANRADAADAALADLLSGGGLCKDSKCGGHCGYSDCAPIKEWLADVRAEREDPPEPKAALPVDPEAAPQRYTLPRVGLTAPLAEIDGQLYLALKRVDELTAECDALKADALRHHEVMTLEVEAHEVTEKERDALRAELAKVKVERNAFSDCRGCEEPELLAELQSLLTASEAKSEQRRVAIEKALSVADGPPAIDPIARPYGAALALSDVAKTLRAALSPAPAPDAASGGRDAEIERLRGALELSLANLDDALHGRRPTTNDLKLVSIIRAALKGQP